MFESSIRAVYYCAIVSSDTWNPSMSDKTKSAPVPEKKGPKPSPQPRLVTPIARPQAATPAWTVAGNLAVQRLLSEGAIQAQLEVSQPDDPYEREAEAAAEALDNSRPPEPISNNNDQLIQRSKMSKENGNERNIAAAHSDLTSIGHPLPAPTRFRMESHFGHNFSAVRVHTGGESSRFAKAISARAFTLGNDIVFREGQYSPDTVSGQRLLAHELAHVVQQSQSAGPDNLLQRRTDFDIEGREAMRERQEQWAREAREQHERWETSHRQRSGTELGSQTRILADERERTEQGIIVQRNRMFEELAGLQNATGSMSPPVALPEDLQARWGAARQALEAIQFGISQGDAVWEMQEDVRPVLLGFYRALLDFAQSVEQERREREERDRVRYETESRRYESRREAALLAVPTGAAVSGFRAAWSRENPQPQPAYRAPIPVSPSIESTIPRADAADTVEQWQQVSRDFNDTTRLMDGLLISLVSHSSEARQGFEYFRGLGERLETLEHEHPLAVRIPAVFYPRDQFTEVRAPDGSTQMRVAKSIPWQFYLYHTGVTNIGGDMPARSGGEWVLIDLTSPRGESASMPSNRAGSTDLDAALLQAGSAVNPPFELFQQLNTKLRFPQGQLYLTMPRGETRGLETTEPWSLSDWFSAIGMTLGAIALIAGIVVSGGLAAPAAVPALTAIATAAGIGAAGFGIASTVAGMSEQREQNMLTQRDIDRATLSIAVDIAGALALGMGRLVAAAGEAGARAGMATRLAAYSGRYWFLAQRGAQVATGAALVGDAAQLMTATSDFINAYSAIQNQPGVSDVDRARALVCLVSTGLLTGGLLAISIRGGIRDLRQGANLHVVDIDAEGRIQINRPGAAADVPPTGVHAEADAAARQPTTHPVEEPSLSGVTAHTGTPAPGWSRRRLLAPAPGPSQVDQSLPGGRVEIHIGRGGRAAGPVTDIQIRHAPDAHPLDIAIHEQIGSLVRRYGGELGRLHVLITRVRRAFGGNPPPLSLQMELRKLRMTAAAHQQRLVTEHLSPQEVRRIENRLTIVRREIDNVEAAIADPALRTRYRQDVVGLPVKPSDVPNLPDPPTGHHYYFSTSTNRWEFRRNPGHNGPRFRVEYDEAGQPTGRATNQFDVEQQLLNRPLNPQTQPVLEQLGYHVDRNNVIYRPRGHDESGRPHMVPLQVDAQGRIQVATTESIGEQQARIRSSLAPAHASSLNTLEHGLAPTQNLRLVEGLHDTGVTWADVLTPQRQAQLRNLLVNQEHVPATEVDRLIDSLIHRTDTLKVVLGTGGVREAFPYRQRFGALYGQPGTGVEVHHGDPLYLGGSSRPETLFGLPEGPHDRLHTFFDNLTLPANGNPPGVRLEPNEIQARVRNQARPAAAIIDDQGNIRYVFLDQPVPTSP